MAASGTALRVTRTLVFGAIMSFLLLLGIEYVAAREIARVEDMMFSLTEQSERSSYLAGDVAEQLARLHANVASAIQRPPERIGVFEKRVAALRGTLDQTLSTLPEVLHPEQRQLWEDVRPKVRQLEQTLLEAFEFARTGEHARAAKLIDEDTDSLTSVYEMLDALYRGNEARLQMDLRNARKRAEHIRMIEAVLGGLLLLGTMLIWLGVLRAVRSQARLLAAYTARVEAVNQDLDAFAGRVAHDLKNALTPLGMAPDMLRASRQGDEKVQVIAARIERSSRKLLSIIDGLLAFSRAAENVDAGETSAIHEVLGDVLEELEPLVKQADVSVVTDVDESLNAQCAASLLHIVITNLCNNAVKFLAGRTTRELRIAVRSQQSWCVLEFQDTGPGIPEHARERIFDPFFRVPGTDAPGTGLGLATVRRIVTAHGGVVTVDSREGKGSRFEVRLPMASSTTDQGSPASLARPEASPSM